MNGLNDVINVLQTCQHIAIAFLILFFIISVVLFFLFDIRKIFNIRSGRAKAKTVSEMAKANAETGRLRVGGKTVTSELSNDEKKKIKKHKHVNPVVMPSQMPVNETINNQNMQIPPAYSYEPESIPTEKLVADEGSESTTVLNNNVPDYPASKFVIIKKIVSVNTDETIN